MIIDNIANWERYKNIHPNIAKALQYIHEHKDDLTLENGTYTLSPDQVIVHVLDKQTQTRESAKMEIHQRFMDIHYIISGAERCGVAPLPEHIDYNSEADNGFWECRDTYSVVIGENEFYAVWPMEPHCPLCHADGQAKDIRKIICKVKVD